LAANLQGTISQRAAFNEQDQFSLTTVLDTGIAERGMRGIDDAEDGREHGPG
jgi:hypothetical protein